MRGPFSRVAVVLTFALIAAESHAAATDPALRHAEKPLRQTILIDGHNDLPWIVRTYPPAPGDVAAYDLRASVTGQTDLARLRQGGLGAQFWSVYVPGEATDGFARVQLEQIEYKHEIRPASQSQ